MSLAEKHFVVFILFIIFLSALEKKGCEGAISFIPTY